MSARIFREIAQKHAGDPMTSGLAKMIATIEERRNMSQDKPTREPQFPDDPEWLRVRSEVESIVAADNHGGAALDKLRELVGKLDKMPSVWIMRQIHVLARAYLLRWDHRNAPEPRPSDMGELARQVAARLRKTRSARALAGHVLVARVTGQNPCYRATLGYYAMTASDFDKLNAAEIADLIQAEEARKAQEWAGDE